MAGPTLGSDGIAGVNDDPTQGAEGPQPGSIATPTVDAEQEDDPQEAALVKKWWKCWEDDRKFDENYRQQVAIDRRYAAGISDLSWAVSTNTIGAFIDILTALLYARDPAVSVKKAMQVSEDNTFNYELFARTLEILITRMWKRGKLRRAAKKAVRSTLSVAEGWFKATMIAEKVPKPQVSSALNDARETLAHLQATEKMLEDANSMDPETRDAEIAEKQALIADLQGQLERAINKMFVVDFVRAENMQVSSDVGSIEDYLDANWVGDEMFIRFDDALARFPSLTEEDLKTAKIYYRHPPKKLTTRDADNVLPQGQMTAESALAFSQAQNTQDSTKFVHFVEIHDRVDKQIRSMIEGVDKWACAPFPPPYPTSRFYPYFYFAFYEVDGERHPQSLSWRMYKLQDEYSCVRSNLRVTRERSIPGVLFNSTLLSNEEAAKLESAKIQEFVGLKTTDPSIPLANAFAPKPTNPVDMRLFDVGPITADMERVSGVQEALSAVQAAPGNPVTATEAAIQQQGTNARTTSARDALEWCLTEMAQYTAEQLIQCMQLPEVQNICGPRAFWPEGMSVEDIFTLVEVEIEAGSTGKPTAKGDQAVWAQILPLLQNIIKEVQQAMGAGNKPVADALIALVKETMRRMGDDTDVTRFIPEIAPPGSPGAGGQPPPIIPNVNVSIKGVLDPQTSAELAAPAVARDAVARPPGNPLMPPGAPGGAPPLLPPGAPGAPPGSPPPGAPPIPPHP